jgi:hypothetical protein
VFKVVNKVFSRSKKILTHIGFSSNKWWASKQEYENPTQTKLQHTLMERKNNTNAQKGILQSTITIIIKSKSEIIANP